MAGQIIKKGDRKYLTRIYRGRDSQTGKRRYDNHLIHGTKKDAQTYINGRLRELDLGTYVSPSAKTLDQYLDEWLETAAKPRVSQATFNGYARVLRSHVRPVIGAKLLHSLRPFDVQAVYARMQERGLSPRMVQLVHAVLSQALRQAVRWQVIPSNPADGTDRPKLKRRRFPRPLTEEEYPRLLEACAATRYAALFRLALTTGMRPEEYLALRWQDVDLERGSVKVERALIWPQKGTGWYFGEPKTERALRMLPLTASTVRALSEHRLSQQEERLKMGAHYRNLDLVFATKWGGPLDPDNLRRRHLKPALARAGLPLSITLYDLRHSWVTLSLAAGVSVKVVSERAGHASVAFTLDNYAWVIPSMDRAADEIYERLFSDRHTSGTPKAQGFHVREDVAPLKLLLPVCIVT
jgi:integrase